MSGSSFDRVMEERKVLVQQIIENMKNGYVVLCQDLVQIKMRGSAS